MIRYLLIGFFRVALPVLVLPFYADAFAQAQQATPAADATTVGTTAAASARLPQLPPLPAGVEDLTFREFFKLPIGPRGLEPTEKLVSLDGKRVRILGYMVHQEQATPGRFILSPLLVSMSEIADGPADDMPASAVFVHLPETDHRIISYTRRPLLLTGRLGLGSEEEPDGRVSYVRLYPDPPAEAPPSAGDGELFL